MPARSLVVCAWSPHRCCRPVRHHYLHMVMVMVMVMMVMMMMMVVMMVIAAWLVACSWSGRSLCPRLFSALQWWCLLLLLLKMMVMTMVVRWRHPTLAGWWWSLAVTGGVTDSREAQGKLCGRSTQQLPVPLAVSVPVFWAAVWRRPTRHINQTPYFLRLCCFDSASPQQPHPQPQLHRLSFVA